MSDWRINGQEKYLSNEIFYKITFPQFWETAYRDKNSFFQAIEKYAIDFVKNTNKGHEFLDGEKIQYFWHEHCEFCLEEAATDKECVFYYTPELKLWVCEKCFNDFREKFGFQEKSESELIF